MNRDIRVAAFASLTSLTACSPRMSERVDPSSIRSIGIGMSEQRVIERLGKPLRIRPWGSDAVLHDYALPGWAPSGPSLWVHFEGGRVRTVHGTRHRIIGDDYAVYEARADRPMFERSDFEPIFRNAP